MRSYSKRTYIIRRIVQTLIAAGVLVAAGAVVARAADPEIGELKAQIKALSEKVMELETRQKTAPPTAGAGVAAAGTNAGDVVTFTPSVREVVGKASPVEDRGAMNDEQKAAPRPDDLTVDPKYRGYIPIPNTPVIMKFNAKPRVDLTSDNRNSGDPDRFITAKIPVQGESGYGGSERFNINARGSQLGLDVRAPEMPGNFRFYYENDFFGSGSGMQYRLRYLYGQYYNFTVGQVDSVFQDPDAKPDTVDYDGPNGRISSRRPLARYTWRLNTQWQMNFGVEQPNSQVSSTNSITQVNRAPDGGFNVRWEKANVGHMQGGAIFRDIGAQGSAVGNQDVFGWGVNLSSNFKVFERDSIQEQVTYGEGIFKYCNDDYVNNDAAYDNSGDLQPIPFFGTMVGYTHRWNDAFRSTASFGYVHLDNEGSQGPNAYHQTYYSSVNVVWQMRQRLTLGLEGLFGYKEEQSGQIGDVWRVQLSAKYSLFD